MNCKEARAILFLGLVVISTLALSEEESVFEVTQLADRIFKLTTDGGGYVVKVIASVGEDGILLVDTGQEQTADALKDILVQRWNGTPKIIINTHAHVEHNGGNAMFGNDAIVVGHNILRKRLRSGSYLFDEFPDEALIDVGFSDSLTLYFNGEEIRLRAFPGAHDDSDIIVWFTESKIVCVGALSNGSHFPSVDEETGDVLKYPDLVAEAIEVLPEDVTIIPGHGDDGTIEEFRTFHEMLVQTTELVRQGMEAGKDCATLQKEDVLKEWRSFDGSYVDADQWIQYLVNGFEGYDKKKALYEPIYYELRDSGIDGAIEHYHELKAHNQDDYRFNEDELVYIAYKLFQTGRTEESVRLFELCVDEYPDGSYGYLCYYYLGKGYCLAGYNERAVKAYRKSLELNPESRRASEIREELKKLEQP